MEAIQFEQVHFSYGGAGNTDDVFSETKTFSLDGIDFSVAEGEFVAVLGHNGSGKSTLARLTNGLLKPTAGKITVFGMDTQNADTLFELRKNVGIVFQNPDNQTVATIVEDDIAFGPENVGVPREEIGERIDTALRAVGMEEYRYATTSRLSGGQKQRIAIAGALALKPRVMILDESTAMLDPRGRKEVIDAVVRLNKEEGVTVLLITHFPEEALLADRAVVMNGGKIVSEGKPQEVLAMEEALANSSLTPPRAVQIARELQRNGLPVADAFSAETLAKNIQTALLKTNPQIVTLPENMGEGTDISSVTDETGRIVCEKLEYVYNAGSPFETHALNGVDVDIPTGAFFGVLGHTGSGKSTFVQHLNALIKVPTAQKKYKPKKKGEIPATKLRVGGYDLTDKHTDFRAVRAHVGMVFQYPEYQLFAETVFADVAFGLKNFKTDLTDAETEQAVREAIEAVGLSYEDVKDKSPFDLSGGQKRRVAIAGVIVTKPSILVLDEPAAGLDPLGKEEIMRLLHALHKTWCKTVVIVSHDMDEIAENCTGTAVFADGKIVAVGTPKQLFSKNATVERAGLDYPFTAKTQMLLQDMGIAIDCDFTLRSFIREVLVYAKEGKKGVNTHA